jgi:hypothetical protein
MGGEFGTQRVGLRPVFDQARLSAGFGQARGWRQGSPWIQCALFLRKPFDQNALNCGFQLGRFRRAG